jgi:type I restriction enzyme, S subunit
MNLVPLRNVCEFKYGQALPERVRELGSVPVYGSNGVVGNHSIALTSGPTIVIGRKGSVGEVNYSNEPCWPIDTTYYVDGYSTKADVRWLSYALQSLNLPGLNKATGVPGLNRNDAYEKELHVPPLDEQRRIAAILDQADALRRKRRIAISTLDDLAQAAFRSLLESRQLSGTANWTCDATLGDIAEIVSGVTIGRKLQGQATRVVPYLAVANVQDRSLRLEAVKSVAATDDEIQRYKLLKDDLLLTEGGDPDKLGRGTLWDERIAECIHQNHIFRVRINSAEVEPLYLNWLVGSAYGKRYFLKSAKQTTGIASINKGQLSKFPLLLPPLQLQHRFVRSVIEIEQMKAKQVAHLKKMEALFSSLQERFFISVEIVSETPSKIAAE